MSYFHQTQTLVKAFDQNNCQIFSLFDPDPYGEFC